MSDEHVYHRALDPDCGDSLSQIAGRVRPGATVLDLGAGPGVLGHHLAQSRQCTVDGVEANPRATEFAHSAYRHWIEANLETLSLDRLQAGAPYDYIVCADVLEHLRQPERLLNALHPLLTSEGALLISVPNVAYAGLVADLLAGRFDYREEGLLDRTHVRFFTRASLLAMLAECGWVPVWQSFVHMPLDRSEFTDRQLDALSPALRDWLLLREDALTYQFVFELVPVGSVRCNASLSSAQISPVLPPELRFRAQLFWKNDLHHYEEAASLVAFGTMGAVAQSLRFVLPRTGQAIRGLRFDPADRPGFMYMGAIRIHDATGRLVAEWCGNRDFPKEWMCHQMQCLGHPPGDASRWLLHLEAGDPLFEMAPAGDWGEYLAEGGMVEIEVSWPMCAGARVLVEHHVPVVQLQAVQQRCAELEAENHALRQQLGATTSAGGTHAGCPQRLRDRLFGWLR